MATATKARSDIKDPKLAPQGKKRILWADRDMPVLARIRERFEKEKPLQGLRLSGCLHVTAETANLARTLKAGGADMVLVASNPLSTQDDVAASLVQDFGFAVFAVREENTDTYYKHIVAALEHEPVVTMDDGADLVSAMIFVALERLDDAHPQVRSWAQKLKPAYRPRLLCQVIGSMDETTTGVTRLRAMDRFDGMLIAQGAVVVDIFITVTGTSGDMRREHVLAMKAGPLVCNGARFDVELDLSAIEREAEPLAADVPPQVDEYRLRNGR